MDAGNDSNHDNSEQGSPALTASKPPRMQPSCDFCRRLKVLPPCSISLVAILTSVRSNAKGKHQASHAFSAGLEMPSAKAPSFPEDQRRRGLAKLISWGSATPAENYQEGPSIFDGESYPATGISDRLRHFSPGRF
jgi:hypothetical protein